MTKAQEAIIPNVVSAWFSTIVIQNKACSVNECASERLNTRRDARPTRLKIRVNRNGQGSANE